MRRISSRLAGVVLLLGASIGVVMSVLGLVGVWTAAPKVTEGVNKVVARLDRSLVTTDDGLTVIADSMQHAQDTIQVMETASDEIAHSVDQTVPMVDRTSSLIGDQMTAVVLQTQSSLEAAKTSAKLVDDTLGLITSIPLIGKRYAPATSLSSSITGVSESLDALPGSFQELQTNLKVSSDNLKTMQGQVETLGSNLHQIGGSVQDAQAVVQRYQDQVTELKADLKTLQDQAPTWITTMKWGLMLFFLWLGIAQISLFLQGAALLGARQPAAVSEVREEGFRG